MSVCVEGIGGWGREWVCEHVASSSVHLKLFHSWDISDQKDLRCNVPAAFVSVLISALTGDVCCKGFCWMLSVRLDTGIVVPTVVCVGKMCAQWWCECVYCVLLSSEFLHAYSLRLQANKITMVDIVWVYSQLVCWHTSSTASHISPLASYTNILTISFPGIRSLTEFCQWHLFWRCVVHSMICHFTSAWA